MSDTFYKAVRFVGRSAFAVSASPLVLGAEHTDRPGGFLLAANHQSPYDIPLLIRHTRRLVDFVSIVEVFRHPLMAWFYGNMNAFPLDRTKPDTPTVRTILDRLEAGRCVGIFPEGGFRNGSASVVHSLRIKPGTARLARLAKVPIVPAIVIGSGDYSRVSAWLPTRSTRYGILFGPAMEPGEDDERGDTCLAQAMAELHRTLAAQLGRSIERDD
jgi:1-acyl-sn-glycerol-3-phosphate acyltransferase